jgi:fibronectin type 3 domain-containing protein
VWHDDRRSDQEHDAMNKIVREHYPVENLPADLREGLGDSETVRVVIEVDAATLEDAPKQRTVKETLEQLEKIRQGRAPDTDVTEAVSRVRALRNEWEDE